MCPDILMCPDIYRPIDIYIYIFSCMFFHYIFVYFNIFPTMLPIIPSQIFLLNIRQLNWKTNSQKIKYQFLYRASLQYKIRWSDSRIPTKHIDLSVSSPAIRDGDAIIHSRFSQHCSDNMLFISKYYVLHLFTLRLK